MNRRPAILISAATILVMLAFSAWAWPQIPDSARVPIHWGTDGQPNGWAPKWIALFITPGIAAIVGVILGVIPSIEPRRSNLARSSSFYLATWAGAMALLGLMHVAAVSIALGADIDIGRVAAILVGFLFIVMGNFLPKTRSNFFAGIRTPWTLTSERSWALTHRLGGRGFVIIGALSLLSGVLGLPGNVAAFVLVGGPLLLVPLLVVVSYRVWRSDPDHQTLGSVSDGIDGDA